ncbi:MAG: hypothetical protein A3G18_00190 [Rhodospirillales bacterium RIFCSPLOWO2_12_FULL_58_28]|nr:MAG: hypothetical protein A3H92_02800 [Rhodospirillales bacterium RIFCSPLOWO2_02_FULL_58_16]OHC79887.1 MAG: hypothetical protein A3G18_00190 [Rhodospirillales bacterium RIFCSPLOWO2_12_FULL_58_28]
MADTEMFRDPKYDPPYPQEFYRFWPRHVIKAGVCVVLTLAAIVALSVYYMVPTDPAMPPLPDEGMFIPAPEWYLFAIFQPFWYLAGDNVALRPVFTFWLPVGLVVFFLAMPLLFGRKRWSGERASRSKKLLMWGGALLVWCGLIGGVVGSGYPAKSTGCLSCHNFMMGTRQALPPANIGKFYREEREQQIKVGKYKIGDTAGVGQSYKDANWQLRHFYEPTMTW